MDIDPDIVAMGGGEWIYEYVLREPISDRELEAIFLRLPRLPSPPASPRLQKTFHLRRITAEICSPPGLTLRSLQWLEQIEEIDRETHHQSPSPAMREAYCLIALHLTIPHPPPPFADRRNDYDSENDNSDDDDDEGAATERFLDAVVAAWKSLISGIGINKASWLCSQGLAEARRTMEASVANPFPHLFTLLRRRKRGGTSRAARDAARDYVQEAFAEMGPSALLMELKSRADGRVPTRQNQGVGLGSGSGGSEGGPEHHHSTPEVFKPREHNVVEEDHPDPGRSEDGPEHHHFTPEVFKPQEDNVVEEDHPAPGRSEYGPDDHHSTPEVFKPQEDNVVEEDHPDPGRSEDGPDDHHSTPEVFKPQEHNVVEEDHPNPAILGGTEDGPDHQHSMAEVSEPRQHNVVEDNHPGPGRSEDGPDYHHSTPEVFKPREHNVVEEDHPDPAILGGTEDDHQHSMAEVSEPREHNVVEDGHPGPGRSEIQMRKRPSISYFSREKKRKPWNAKEEETLREACMMYGEGNWKLIKEIYALTFVERTVVNLKDKWRNMKEKEEKEKGKENKNEKRRRR